VAIKTDVSRAVSVLIIRDLICLRSPGCPVCIYIPARTDCCRTGPSRLISFSFYENWTFFGNIFKIKCISRSDESVPYTVDCSRNILVLHERNGLSVAQIKILKLINISVSRSTHVSLQRPVLIVMDLVSWSKCLKHSLSWNWSKGAWSNSGSSGNGGNSSSSSDSSILRLLWNRGSQTRPGATFSLID
jgi:hypothetical protein